MTVDTIRAAARQFFVKCGIHPCRIVVAVSGGADSTALLLTLVSLPNFEISAAHVNHQLRGSDSAADETFVRKLCASLGVPLDVADGTLDPDGVRERGIEAAAREIRYARLAAIRAARGARYVATAHQKDDQAETVLMRLLTGSGLAGLRGIHPLRDDGTIRPLLDVTRAEIDAFLAERGIVPRHDRSNDDPRFLRNRLRGLIRELDATQNLAAVADQARAQWPALERMIGEAERAHAAVGEDETRFTGWPDDEWLRAALLQRHIRRLDPQARDFDARRIASELNELKRTSVTKHLEMTSDRGLFVLRRKRPTREEPQFEITFTEEARIEALDLTIRVTQPATSNQQPATGPKQRFQLPPSARAAFTVRTRKPGDRFHPLGLAGSKKLSDFLIDRKIAAEVRDRLPLLIWNEEIVWVAGVEVSERFKVTGPGGGAVYEAWLEGSGADDADHSPVRR